MANSDALKALDMIEAGGFALGPDLDAGHEICQDHEGTPLFDWVHALIHRIEGDDGNAAYWYRRAGQSRHPGSIQQEWQIIRSAAESA